MSNNIENKAMLVAGSVIFRAISILSGLPVERHPTKWNQFDGGESAFRAPVAPTTLAAMPASRSGQQRPVDNDE